MLQNCFRFG